MLRRWKANAAVLNVCYDHIIIMIIRIFSAHVLCTYQDPRYISEKTIWINLPSTVYIVFGSTYGSQYEVNRFENANINDFNVNVYVYDAFTI